MSLLVLACVNSLEIVRPISLTVPNNWWFSRSNPSANWLIWSRLEIFSCWEILRVIILKSEVLTFNEIVLPKYWYLWILITTYHPFWLDYTDALLIKWCIIILGITILIDKAIGQLHHAKLKNNPNCFLCLTSGYPP